MQYLLDTHVILWWFTTPEQINKTALKIIKDKTNTIFLSSVSFWEMAIKQSIGRLTMPHNLLETASKEGFKMLPIFPEECLGITDLPSIHSDPFDRLLVVQSKLHDLVLITRDKKILDYPVVTIKA